MIWMDLLFVLALFLLAALSPLFIDFRAAKERLGLYSSVAKSVLSRM